MQKFIFVVTCERIKKQGRYIVHYRPNDQLTDRVKALPSGTKKWITDSFHWEITTRSLYSIIKIYKNSTKIKFDFGSEEGKKVFIDQIRKIDRDEKERVRLLDELKNNKEKWLEFKNQLDVEYEKYSDKVHANLNEGIQLYPHQITAVMFLDQVKNALISHEMGLGKTVEAIAYSEMNGFGKILVITPNSLKFNFYNEIKKFTDSSVHIINWRKNKVTIDEAKYVIVNYDFFNGGNTKRMDKKFKGLGITNIDCLICDESTRLKNTSSNTYKNFKRIFKKGIDSKVFLSGTPAPNRAQELYTILNQISPLEFPTKDYFLKNYLGMEYDPDVLGGWVKNPTMENLEQLYHNIEPFTHRKRKAEVLTDLPDKIFQNVVLEMTPKQLEIYDDVEQGIPNEYINEEVELPITRMLRSRQYTASIKLKTMIEFVDRMLDEGQKVVVIDFFKETLQELKNHYKDKAVLHIGDYSVEDRAIMVEEFQDPNSGVEIFLGSIPTSKEGLTLTAASRIFLLTHPYGPGEFDQVVDRLHRIGQKDVVNIYFLMFLNTIDEYVFEAVENKRKEVSKVIDNEDYDSDVEKSVISEVMAKIARKHGSSMV